MPRSQPIADVPRVLELKELRDSDRPKLAAPEQTFDECPICGGARHPFDALPAVTYAYLLGVYLGDGWLAHNGSSWTLRIALDSAYPGIVAEVARAMKTVCRKPEVFVRPHHSERCVEVSVTWRPWLCLFPQHGPGRKHHRRIALADWQQTIVEHAPRPFLRGLIQTDGWRGLNRVHVKGRDYAYPRYQFSNRSDDIRRLFTDVLDLLGVEWRQWTRYHVSVARRECVAFLDSFIGPKY